jgi:hypothetical protein
MTDDNDYKFKPYVVLVTSDRGTEAYDYPDLDEALEGLARLALAGVKQKDNVDRRYRVVPSNKVRDDYD